MARNLALNFQFATNAQTLKAEPRSEIQAAIRRFTRLAVDDLVVSASKQSFKSIKRSLEQDIKRVIQGEIGKMAHRLGQYVAEPDKHHGPSNISTIRSGMSTTARRFGFQSSFDHDTAKIRWSARGEKYLAQKKKKGGPAKWWEYRGQLKKSLSHEGLYTRSFGPIEVSFIPLFDKREPRAGIDPQTLERHNRGQFNITSAGTPGPNTFDHLVGRLEVKVFGKITPAMLPALAHPMWNPALAAPNDGKVGMARLLTSKPARRRLTRLAKDGTARYVLEPFVSFYLTRAIPNAVWSRTEKLINPASIFIRG